MLALETVPDVDEAAALLTAVEGLDVPAWLSYTISGDRTRAGQSLAEAFAVATGNDQVVAVGVNCCDPAEVPGAVAVAVQVTGKPVIAYPNSGEGWDPVARRWTGASRFTAAGASRWLAAGATIIGGCCRVRPADLAPLAAGGA
ncbi:hypothetical protein GCM10027521_13190 [Amycolatopsis cihanbeyliensis]